jgi:hypothetical protein
VGYIQHNEAQQRLEFIRGRPSLTASLVIQDSAFSRGTAPNGGEMVAINALLG